LFRPRTKTRFRHAGDCTRANAPGVVADRRPKYERRAGSSETEAEAGEESASAARSTGDGDCAGRQARSTSATLRAASIGGTGANSPPPRGGNAATHATNRRRRECSRAAETGGRGEKEGAAGKVAIGKGDRIFPLLADPGIAERG